LAILELYMGPFDWLFWCSPCSKCRQSYRTAKMSNVVACRSL